MKLHDYIIDEFTAAYIEAMLWASTCDPYGTCPSCGMDNQVLCRWIDENNAAWKSDSRCVCANCSEREPNHEPPADSNYSSADLAPDTVARIVADCATFQHLYGEHITEDSCNRRGGNSHSPLEMAGHDFWLTRNGHGCGFWDGDWQEPQASTLDKASKEFGELDLYVGDDGQLYLS